MATSLSAVEWTEKRRPNIGARAVLQLLCNFFSKKNYIDESAREMLVEGASISITKVIEHGNWLKKPQKKDGVMITPIALGKDTYVKRGDFPQLVTGNVIKAIRLKDGRFKIITKGFSVYYATVVE